jgi:glycosyltransferase involved in cell wall biosynthesis
VRILLFHFAELGGLGGVEVVVVQLARAFRERGHAAAILEVGKSWRSERKGPGGIPLWTLTAPSYLSWQRPRSWASFARATFQFKRVLGEFQPDVVNVHFPLIQCLPAVGADLLPHNWRLISTVHNSDIRVAPLETPAIRHWQARLFRRSDRITAVSRSLLDDTLQLYPFARDKSQIICNGVPSHWLEQPLSRQPPPERYVLFAGRLHHVKGVDLLLHAWNIVARDYPDTELYIVGDGPENQSLREMTFSLGLSDRVCFLGRKGQTELPALYRNAEVVILPSRREGLPLSILEASACGAICIGTKIPGIPEILTDGVDGYLCEPESVESLAVSLRRALDAGPAFSNEMREAARRNIRHRFSEEGMVESYLDCFSSVLSAKPSVS